MSFMRLDEAWRELSTLDFGNQWNDGTPSAKFFSLFNSPLIPFVCVFLYWVLSKPICDAIRTTFNLEPRGNIQKLVILHSFLLAVYSGWTFIFSTQIVVERISEVGFYESICDPDKILWKNRHLSFWVAHFYISKYYEFVDTWIVLLKGKDPMFLQTFHHAGIVILMWGFVVTSNTVVLVIVCFNSLIHTMMYTYYTCSALSIEIPGKKYMTQAQIIQFMVGIGITFLAHFKEGCLTPGQSLVLFLTQLYAVALIVLFVQFYIKSYSDKKQSKGGEKKKI